MHGIGEIDHIGVARQRDQLSFRGEAEHLIVEQLELGVLEKFLRVGAVGQDPDGVAQPGEGVGFALQEFGRRADAVLVEGVRGDAEFGDLVHLLGADLQFDPLVAGTDHGGVDGAVVVLFRGRDVVLEAARHHRPGGVHHAERAVAGLDVIHHDAESEDVGQLLEPDRLALHLGPDRKRPLAPAIDVRRHAVLLQVPGELVFDFADQVAVAFLQRFQPLHHHRMRFRIEHAERQVFELFPHLLHAHAAGERGVDVEGFLGDAAARGRRHEFQRPHVVQAVGELDQEHADVVGDRQQQLAQILGLLGLARHQFEPLQLCQPLHQRADLVSEDGVDLGAGGLGILDGIVQQRGHDGGIVELEVGEDRRDLERVREIGIPGGAGLRAMRLHRVDIGAIEQILVGVRIVRPDAFDQIVLPHHARARGLGRPGRRRHRPRRRHGDRFGRGLHLPGGAAPIRHRITAFAGPMAAHFMVGSPGRSVARNQLPSPGQNGVQPGRIPPALRPGPIVTIKKANKSKGPDKCPGLWQLAGLK